jgi:Tetracyclin repressor-like, C-terminal domain
VTRPLALPHAVKHTEWSLRALADLDPTPRLFAYLTLFGFARGIAASVEAEAQAEQDTGLGPDKWMATQEHVLRPILDGDDLPALSELVEHDIDFDLDELFEFGLQRVLDGLAELFI